MPDYEFFCRTCSKAFEERMSIKEHDERTPRCPSCGSSERVQRVASRFNVQTRRKA